MVSAKVGLVNLLPFHEANYALAEAIYIKNVLNMYLLLLRNRTRGNIVGFIFESLGNVPLIMSQGTSWV